ncbi:flagellar protein [Gracilibacillus halophilus YIM-C55.5]|uniref:Flagellar FliJ protein n=1 Tax=Gracilibacillus halophilus YIM-C55.5 TaxID=1308866 RepID=N4WD67_9BACI|nr:flagellar export protein FliJ [Gracilibacillus halophilus]ENH98238.1 flagellar protein [Gracilibacillus halophilus YIM-C55.5]
MADVQSLEKMKMIRNQDKQQAQFVYQQKVDEFETLANQLVDLLRKKEVMEAKYNECLSNQQSIQTIHSYHNYLQHLTPTIMELQQRVNRARDNMRQAQEKLTEQHIEEKKMEKLIDRKRSRQYELDKKSDMKLMDDISLQQYLKSKGR